MRVLPIVLLALALSGCVRAGPDYVKPELGAPEAFEQADGATFDTATEKTAVWQDFDDPVLTALIARGLERNTDIRAAAARLEASRALSGLSVYSLFPTVTAETSSERNRQSNRDPFTFPGIGVTDIKRQQFDSLWEIDLFGSLKRQNQQIVRRVEADAALLADMRRTISAEIAQSYFTWRGLNRQLEVQTRNVAAQQRSTDILQRSLEAGRGTALDVARARTLERTLASTVPDLHRQVSAARQRLAVLLADASTNVDTLLHRVERKTTLPELPGQVRVGTPEAWLARRPDVRAAERQLAQATAAIGVEAAEFYPKLNLLGSFGFSGTEFDDLGVSDARRWNFGPVLQWRFLDFGRVRQNVRSAQASEQEALANFQGAMLRALEDMENSLASYRAATASSAALDEALTASQRATEIATLRFDNGAANYLEVLDAERTRLDLEFQVAQARTARLTALVAVYKALAVD